MNYSMKWLKASLVALAALVVAACSHPITITPLEMPDRNNKVSSKNAAYVMTDAQRAVRVTTPGGGGDKIDYQPYRDLEKAIRDALGSVYNNVVVIKGHDDTKAILDNEVSFVFTPIIHTTSSSDSAFTWPPTAFTIELNCSVRNAAGTEISSFTVTGQGAAEFSEFKSDFGLAGRRAASDLSQKLREKLLEEKQLH